MIPTILQTVALIALGALLGTGLVALGAAVCAAFVALDEPA